ncbi:unnamed protein product [Gadus morhua 'NCC']
MEACSNGNGISLITTASGSATALYGYNDPPSSSTHNESKDARPSCSPFDGSTAHPNMTSDLTLMPSGKTLNDCSLNVPSPESRARPHAAGQSARRGCLAKYNEGISTQQVHEWLMDTVL